MSAAPARRISIALDDRRPIWRSLGIFLIPLMLSSVLQSLGQTANSVYLGRLLGLRSLAAVSAIFPIVFFLVSFMIGLGAGASVLIGQAFGARDDARVKEIAGTTVAATVVLGAVVGGLGALLARPMLAALHVPAEILPISASYARIVFATIPVTFVYIGYTTFLRGTGDTRTPFWALVASTVLTFALTPALMLGWLGLPRLGTNGAAVGNVASTALTLAGLFVYLARTKHALAPDRALLVRVRLRPALIAQVARIGIPTSINLVMVSLSEIALLSLVNSYGTAAVAAYGAVNQVVSYVQFPAISIGIAASVFAAQSIGAGRTDRIATIVRSATILNYAIEGVLIALVYALREPIVSLFIASPATVHIADALLAITLWGYAIFGNARVLSAIMISSGTVIWPTLISVGSIWAVEVPVAYALSARVGLQGVWYGYPAAFVTALALQTAYYVLVWRKRPIRTLV